ncbi:MAG: hypothetical protein IJ736_00725, partial [Firmicutes bacterium]|nr:hypothetical protein [Bacillota bacterium]
DKENIFHTDDEEIVNIIKNMQKIILPWYYHNKVYKVYTIRNHISMLIEDVAYNLKKQIAIVLKYNEDVDNTSSELAEKQAEEITVKFLRQIPKIRNLFETDLQAAYDGDPSAEIFNEIIYAFPGVYAVMIIPRQNYLLHILYYIYYFFIICMKYIFLINYFSMFVIFKHICNYALDILGNYPCLFILSQNKTLPFAVRKH